MASLIYSYSVHVLHFFSFQYLGVPFYVLWHEKLDEKQCNVHWSKDVLIKYQDF